MKLLRYYGYRNEIYAEKEQHLKPYYQFMNSIPSGESDTSLYRDIARIKLGVLGEDDLIKELDLYNDMFDYGHRWRVEYQGSSVESDVIIYSRKGIFHLEAKNYGKSGSYNLHIAKDDTEEDFEEWTRRSNGQCSCTSYSACSYKAKAIE